MTTNYYIGQRISFESALCTVRYIGPVTGTEKEWIGVEWDDPSRGKHDGVVKGVRYFECRVTQPPTAASFVRPSRKADPERSFVEAVHQKYAAGITSQQPAVAAAAEKQIVISGGKVAEEIGFDKIRAQLARLQELKIVIVDGLQISSAETPDRSIKDVCPKIVELDLSRNLFVNCREILRICDELEHLKLLRLNGNRLSVEAEDFLVAPAACEGLLELELDETYLSWTDISQVANHASSLKILTASSNGLESLDINTTESANERERHKQPSNVGIPVLITGIESMVNNLTSLTLEYNNFNSLCDLLPLTEFQALEKLHLKGNQISQIRKKLNLRLGDNKLVFGTNIRYVDLSYNVVKTWDFVDDLATTFPGLIALRFSHNPLYDTIAQQGGTAVGVEDGYMFTLARLGNLKMLNFSNITTAERTNAEMFYLSRIGKDMAEVSEDKERTVTAQHKRFGELCEIYGAPTVVRKGAKTINPDFLEARLIKFTFYMATQKEADQNDIIIKSREIPKGFDIYKVKGIVGKIFGIRPLSMRLIWETGEWDPVAGYEEDDSSDEDDEEARPVDIERAKSKENGKWMKREVELEDSTRQVGFCIDGMEAKVRIEIR